MKSSQPERSTIIPMRGEKSNAVPLFKETHGEPIAITGLGCRLPGGANGPQAFWDLMMRGVDAITEIPPDRWSIPAFYDPESGLPGKTNSKWGGFLDGIDQFDPGFFGLSPREAAAMDPQQRLLLETSWEAIEDAGFVPDPVAGSRTGVFVGISTFDYWRIQTSYRDKTTIGTHTTTGTVLSIAANRISYLLNLHGPSLVVDTACSSSLVAVHLACESLWSGACEMALAGGVNAILIPDTFIGFSKMAMLSPDGRCKAFDARGNGFVRGEGVGVIVLKPLAAARAAGDRIYAVIRGSAVNQDGRTSSLTIPGSEAQSQLIREACRSAQIDPVEIDYVEAHGTGTAVGDPIETSAIGNVLGGPARKRPCVIGSVKTNIGHLEAGSGIAGIIKTALVLHHGVIPPNLHFEKPNPKIEFEKWKLRVPVKSEKLPREDSLAAINSFGFGGTNAHVVLQRVPRLPRGPETTPVPSSKISLLLLSAQDEAGLQTMASQYAEWLGTTEESLTDICHTLANNRRHQSHRMVVVAGTKAEMISKLEAFVRGETQPGLCTGRASPPRKIAFVFTGQGPQWWGMGRELLATNPLVRSSLAECDTLFRQWGNWSLIEEMTKEEADSQMDRPAIAQPAIFALQVALTRWWQAHGIEPSAVIGHSVGEAAAAYFSGALDLPSAAKVIFERGRCMELIPPTGKMLAVALAPAAVVPWMAGFKRQVEIGAINSPHSVVLSGAPDALNQIAAKLDAANIWCRFLRVNYAFHSAQMDPVKSALKTSLRTISSGPARVPICSTVTGKISIKENFQAEYWWGNVRKPVQFASGIGELVREGFEAFLEVGPHPALSAPVTECLRAAAVEGFVVGSLRRAAPEEEALMGSLGALHVRGIPVRWPEGGRRIDLPMHSWRHERYWQEAAESIASRLAPAAHPLLGLPLSTSKPIWEPILDMECVSYMGDHKLNGRGIFPAAGYVEMAVAAARDIHKGTPIILEDVEFSRMLMLPDSGQTTPMEMQCQNGSFTISANSSDSWTAHCKGRFREEKSKAPNRVPLGEIRFRCQEERTGKACYEEFQKSGFHFGECFRGISRVFRRDGEALAEIVANDSLRTEGYIFHPALLDSCFQTLLATLTPKQSERGMFLPARIGSVRVFSPATRTIWSHVRLKTINAGEVIAQFRLLDEDGNVLAEIKNFCCSAIERPTTVAGGLGDCFYELGWREIEKSGIAEASRWVLVGGDQTASRSVAEAFRQHGISQVLAAGISDFENLLTTSENFSHIAFFAEGGDDAQKAGEECLKLMKVAQMLEARNSPVRLCIVTCCAHPLENQMVSPVAGAVAGLARVLMNESQTLECRLIDLGLGRMSETADSAFELESLVEELQSFGEEEVAIRGTKRMGPRLAKMTPTPRLSTGDITPYRLEAVKPGVLDHLTFCALPERAPGVGEVKIEVLAAGLNFRDVMKALGIYPIEEPGDELLGDECSGRVLAVGEGTKNFEVGDEVIVIAPGSFSKFQTISASCVVKKPRGLSFEEAATLPVTFLTAHYALHHLAGIQRGEKVLIHAAAGGVGLAAMQLALSAGAEVFATAGSDEKRALVRSLGASHVMDSRSLDFAEEIMELTSGKGVDIVLNSLAGEAIPKSLAVLSPYGRFVEIGKRDIHQNSRIGLRPFSKNLSFFAVDLSRLLRDRPAFIQKSLVDLMARFESGELNPLLHTTYPADHFLPAFREMASGKHTGKIVFSFKEPARIPVKPSPDEPLTFPAEATYLITGGVGGFGLTIADYMVAHGARNLVLIGSRKASADAARSHFADAASRGIHIVAKAVDVSNGAAVDDLMAEINSSMPPLRGIFHAAMKIDDGVISQLNEDRFQAVMAPKALGAWNLHAKTKALPLDFFVMFSSVASVIGNPGQGNYVAANAYLDALAHHRHSLGLPAMTINWGHLGQVGYVSRNAHVSDYLNRHGIAELSPQEAHELFGVLIRSDGTQASAMRIDWQHWAEANPRLKKAPKFRDMVSIDVGGKPRESVISMILGSQGELRRKKIVDFVRETASRVLGIPSSQLDPSRPLGEFGLDSLMSIELVNRLEEGIQSKLPVEKIGKNPSIQTMAKLLAKSLPEKPGDSCKA